MALEPITRQEKIIAGQDLTPITRMEHFLKQYGGSGGSGGGGGGGGSASGQLIVTVYPTNVQGTKFAADKTYDEISAAIDSGMSVVLNFKGDTYSSNYEVYYPSCIEDGYYSFFNVSLAAGDFYCYFINIYEENGEMGIDKYSGQMQIVP